LGVGGKNCVYVRFPLGPQRYKKMQLKTLNLIAVVSYVGAGIALVLVDQSILPTFYQPKVMSTLAFVSAILIVLPQVFLRPTSEEKRRVLHKLQFAIALGLLINGIGGLGLYELYKYGIPYDKVAHFVTPLIFLFAIFEFTRTWFDKGFALSLEISGAAVFSGGIAWEFLEIFSDSLIGTSLFGGGTGGAIADTVGDLIMNILGIAVGVVWLVRKQRIVKRASSV